MSNRRKLRESAGSLETRARLKLLHRIHQLEVDKRRKAEHQREKGDGSARTD